jgi:16S rRNA (guanine527-N7)-methyltransferase
VELRRETVEKLWQYHRLLIESNSDGDLTRLRSFPTIVERHYADSILPSAYVPHWPSPMIDIGTGAGFPGIPLKIVHPEIDLTLCEPRPQRIAFLQKVIDRLELQGVEVFGHKVTSQSMRRPIRGAMSRAFELFPKTLLRLENSMEIGGRAYFFKGPAAVEELKEWKRSPMEGWEVVEEHWFTIPNSTQERSLIVVERVG